MRNVKKLGFCILILTGLILLVPVLNGCSEKAPADDNPFMELLSLFPASASEDGCFFLIDYETLWGKYGINFPEIIEDNNALLRLAGASDALSDTRSPDAFILNFSSYYTGWGLYTNWMTHSKAKETPIQKKCLGYDIRNIDAEINNSIRRHIGILGWDTSDLGIPVPDLRVAAIGTFEPESTENALSNRDNWPDWAVESYTSESYRKITIHNWVNGTDNHSADAFSPPDLDRYGRAMPFAVSNNNLFVSDSVKNIKSMIDSSLGKSATLADVEEYASVAKALHEFGAYAAIIGDEALANGQWVYPGENKLLEFLTFGTGYARDEKGTYIALVLFHDSAEKAKANVNSLIKRVSEYRPDLLSKPGEVIYDTKIYNEGKILLAKLYTDDPQLWSWWLLSGGSFLYHKE